MTTRLRRPIPAFLIVAAAVFLAAPSETFAQDDAFKKGIAARKDKKWVEAASGMRAAINSDPKESPRRVGALVGLGGDQYLPHFYLGEALYLQNDCGGALAAWEESDRQGVARKVGNNARVITDGIAQCEAKGFLSGARYAKEAADAGAAYRTANDAYAALNNDIAAHPDIKVDAVARSQAQSQITLASDKLKLAERTRRAQDLAEVRTLSDSANGLIQSARQAIAKAVAAADMFAGRVRDVESLVQQADAMLRDLDAMFGSTLVKVSPSDSVTSDRTRASALIGNAREKARAGRTQNDAEVMEAERAAGEAMTLIGRARTQFESEVNAAIGAELADLDTRSVELFAPVEARARMIEEGLRKRPAAADTMSEFTKLQVALTRARRNFDRAIRARDLVNARAAVEMPSQLGPQFDGLAARIGIVETLVPPEVLLRAAQALFEGRYRDALAAMSPEAAGSIETPLRIHAYVIRAAALFALYEHSGASDDALRVQAREAADVGRSLDANFRPRTDAFSPRFIDFFLALPQGAR